MTEKNILDELTPPEEKREHGKIDASIIEVVKDRKISYPAEIAGDTGISRQTCFDHIRHLAKQGKLERVSMRMFVPDELKERLQELWDMGLKGGMIKRMSWYRIPDAKKVGGKK
jgi:predicted DNA-binding protein YlxM (UPF0122 family)